MLVMTPNNRLLFPVNGRAFVVTAVADNVPDAYNHMEHTRQDCIIAELNGLYVMADSLDAGTPLAAPAPFPYFGSGQ